MQPSGVIASLIAPTSPSVKMELGIALVFFALIFVAMIAGFIFMRRSIRDQAAARNEVDESFRVKPENPSAFVTASMEGVIVRLREQEHELERLHKLEKERAQESERMSEAVTRNMPAGLLLVNANGMITSSNPAAESVLGIPGLRYRRYTEILGSDSPLTQMLAACLRDGHT